MRSIVFSEFNLEQAAHDSVIELECPECQDEILSEPDADVVSCGCGESFKVINPYF